MKVYIGPYKEDDSPRKESIHIHDYDTWNMDHTLALIALPMLKQLKETEAKLSNEPVFTVEKAVVREVSPTPK